MKFLAAFAAGWTMGFAVGFVLKLIGKFVYVPFFPNILDSLFAGICAIFLIYYTLGSLLKR